MSLLHTRGYPPPWVVVRGPGGLEGGVDFRTYQLGFASQGSGVRGWSELFAGRVADRTWWQPGWPGEVGGGAQNLKRTESQATADWA